MINVKCCLLPFLGESTILTPACCSLDSEPFASLKESNGQSFAALRVIKLKVTNLLLQYILHALRRQHENHLPDNPHSHASP